MARLTISCIVRRFCLDCQGNSSKAVRECADTACALWEHRLPPQGAESPAPGADTVAPAEADAAPAPTAPVLDTGDAGAASLASSTDAVRRLASNPGAAKRLAARRAILRAVRRHCMSCAACRADVRTCAARECGLWSYRFGVYPETYRAVRQRFFRPKTLSLF